jgi:long-chain acyl-CoA synthetase
LGEVGEVLINSDSVMAGYWRNPEATQAAIRDGWLFTGDMGSLDAHGFLTLKDRSKDLIISGGSNVYPREVEEALLTHPAVLECAVVGMPDAAWGEVGVACVVPRGAAPEAAALLAHLVPLLARYKHPRRFVFWEELPKSAYGKVPKAMLRERLDRG